MDDPARIEALQDRAALLADQVETHVLALRDQFVRLEARGADDVGVERTRQTTLRRRDHQQMLLVATGAREQFGAARADGDLRRQARHHGIQPLGIGPAGLSRHLRATQLGGGDHLHRLGDLLGRFDRGDPVLECLEAGHLFQSLTRRSWRTGRARP